VTAVRPALTVLAGIVVLAVAGCGGSDSASPPAQASSAARPAVADLKSIDTLKADFNADAGRSRLLLILSPT
jgi:hypothetical protein